MWYNRWEPAQYSWTLGWQSFITEVACRYRATYMDIGLVFAFLTAVFLAMGTIFLRRGVVRAGESFSALAVTVFINTIILLLVVTLSSEWNKVWSIS